MAINTISRAQFLRGDYRGRESVIRPPWSLAEQSFVEHCTRCGDCFDACPEKILKPGRGGFPQVDFAKGECTFCQACMQACRQAAFDKNTSSPWSWRAVIGESCLSNKGVACVTCAEQCETGAIHFMPCIGSVARPQLDATACNGCGACYRPCPAGAIRFQKLSISSEQPSQRLEAYS